MNPNGLQRYASIWIHFLTFIAFMCYQFFTEYIDSDQPLLAVEEDAAPYSYAS